VAQLFQTGAAVAGPPLPAPVVHRWSAQHVHASQPSAVWEIPHSWQPHKFTKSAMTDTEIGSKPSKGQHAGSTSTARKWSRSSGKAALHSIVATSAPASLRACFDAPRGMSARAFNVGRG